MNPEDILKRFEHHPPTSREVSLAHEQVRFVFREVAQWLNNLVPDSREKSQAITKLDDACMHANAAIARYQQVDEGVLDVSPSLPSLNHYLDATRNYGARKDFAGGEDSSG